jgi:CrcB protein
VKQLLLVGLGGALGAVARWKLGGAVLHHTADWRFPLSTFVVNAVGCLVAGVLAGLVTKLDLFSADARLFLFTGLLGGFTTFSAFGVETVYLLRRAEYGVAIAYAVSSVVVGVAGLWLALAAIHATRST